MITDTNYCRGFYQVGDQIYLSKFHAILASQKTGHFPQWNFHEHIFSQYDWTVEPVEDLWEIYRQRAQQIRDKYDYIVLLFSGGSDSTNILQSFLYNNIKIDEIFVYAPFSSNQMDKPITADNESSYYREIDQVALPYLNELAKTHKFKVTTYDTTPLVFKIFTDPDWIYTEVGDRFSPACLVRNYLFEGNQSALKQLDAGKKMCFITGIDKPRLINKDGVMYYAFLEGVMAGGIGPKYQLDQKNHFVEEMFYWTPDMPKLVIKQAHIMKNYFLTNPEKKYLIDGADLGSWKYKDEYAELSRLLVYPYWNRSTFQVKKPTTLTFMAIDEYFILSNTKAKDNWLNGIKEARKIINPYWISQDNDPRITGSWSKWYKIG